MLLESVLSGETASIPVAAITIPWPENGGATIQSSTGETAWGNTLAQRTLDRRIWNEIRVSKAGGVCRVQINGARLMEIKLPKNLPAQFAIRLSALDSGSEQQFRYIRTGPHSADERAEYSNPDVPKFSKEADAESSSEVLIGMALAAGWPDSSGIVTLADIRSGWRKIESAYANSEVKWQQKAPELLNWYNGTSLPGESLVESSMRFCGSDWDFHSSRLDLPDQIPEGLDISPAVRKYLPERESHLFIPQLFSRFSLSPPVNKFHRLTRQIRSGRLAELRVDSAGRTKRVILHQIPEEPSAAFALLSLEKPAEAIPAKLSQLNDRCLTLDQCGAMLALRPINGLFSGPKNSSLVEPSSVACRDVECKRVVDRSDDGLQERIWLVAAQAPHPIIRYIGTAGEESVQIDIQWDLTFSPPRPSGWSSMFCWTTGRPTNYFSKSTVHRMESLQSPQSALSNFIDDVTKLPVGTWVDDRTQNTQYLIGQDGKHRTITLAEQCWLPKVEELLQTESGKVNRLIERKMLFRRWTSGVRGWILLATLSGCVVLVVVRSLVRKLGK